jgi:NADH:ubiquinone oxidoreductase subunit F (NADH-binding)
MIESRVLPSEPLLTLDAYRAAGGGTGLDEARAAGPDAIIDEITASGIGGRGGAGFPAGRKWATVRANHSELEGSSVVVNAAEGEPGSFKDRAIIRANPFAILEGALIAAIAVGADELFVATKRAYTREVAILREAIAAVEAAGWNDGVTMTLFEGPSEYLYGEETALLEVLDGRFPFPRIAPPYRRGVDEVVDHRADVDTESSSAAHVEMAGPTGESIAPPSLASNVETYANAALIIARGADWFRSVGTEGSPGTIVCTISGCTQRAGIGEFVLGTPVREVIETLGGGARPGHKLVAAMSGVSNPLLPASQFDTPMSHEAMRAIGNGVGTGGYIVYDDTTDFAAVAAGVARFLAVESCGQCRACKQDGLTISEIFGRIARSHPHSDDLEILHERLESVTDGARCNIATQEQIVVSSILDLFPDDIDEHARDEVAGIEPEPIAAIAELEDGVVHLDPHQQAKQPDWTFDPVDSGQWPADRLDDKREHEEL